MSNLLYSAPVVDSQLELLKHRVNNLRAQHIIPHLKIIQVGNHPASHIYVQNKKKFAEKINAECEIIHCADTIDQHSFLQLVKDISQDAKVHGMLIQLPLPQQLQHLEVGRLVPAHKDVDGFHPENLFELLKGNPRDEALMPCTPKGILTLLKHYQLHQVKGKNVVILGRSLIVGKPMALLMTNLDATVTICHSQTPTDELQRITKEADLIIVAIGKAKFLNDHFIGKKRPVVIDVGINTLPNNKICGDVDFDKVKHLVSAISPVPKGVGPLTILSLAQNLLHCASLNSH